MYVLTFLINTGCSKPMWFSKGMVPGQNVEVSYLPGSLVEYKCPNTSDNVGYSMYV